MQNLEKVNNINYTSSVWYLTLFNIEYLKTFIIK